MIAEIAKLSVVAEKNHEKQKVISNSKFSRLHDLPCSCFVCEVVIKILTTLLHACEILPRNLLTTSIPSSQL